MVVLLHLSEKDRNIMMKRWLKEVHLKKEENEKIIFILHFFWTKFSVHP